MPTSSSDQLNQIGNEYFGRGLYTGAEGSPSAHQSAIEVTRLAPKAVVCLLSALEIHGIGVQAPFEVWIALPAGTHAPKGAQVALRVTRLSGEAFTEGIETVVLVMLMLFLTIGWRESLVAALSIPLSFVIAFIGLYVSGNTINFLSLFSLIFSCYFFYQISFFNSHNSCLVLLVY